MNDRKSELFLLLGAWVSLVSVVTAGTLFLPPAPVAAEENQALLYRIATNEVLARPSPAQSAKRIFADLDGMTITLYENEEVLHSFPILSKGREGTFWETPTGTYEVGARSERHFSSIGGTWMPYSLQFYGNFFIHGWPTYPDGTPVAKGYSGGCIRLDTNDARVVYEFAQARTPIFVTGGASLREFATSSRYYLRSSEYTDGTPTALPAIAAPSFLIADIDSGNILWQRAASTTVPAGVATSLLTGLTALETVNQYKIVSMGQLLLGNTVLHKESQGSPDELSVGALIYPLLFDANDTAARAFAREHGEKNFVRAMEQKARAIGMADSDFVSPLSEVYATSTARDLYMLLSYVNEHKHFLMNVSMTEERTFVAEDGVTRFRWDNKNPWLHSGDARYKGGVGHVREDGSGSAFVIFALPLSEWSDRSIAFIVPESPNIMGDIEQLRAFVMEHYVYGIERDNATFIREEAEPTPSLLDKVRRVLDLDELLRKEAAYQREV
jgi:hypothetical protein